MNFSSARAHRLLGSAAVMHGAAALGTLLLGGYYNWQPLLGVWMPLACAWVLWPVALLLHPARSPRRVVVPVLLGGVLWVPCALLLFIFLCWSSRGLAP